MSASSRRPGLRRADLAALPTLRDCVHCGLCLPACPTFAATGRESQSPRGRIAALRALAEGRSELTPGLADGLDDCLVCRACESHCPSGIVMESLLPGYRAARDRAGGSGRGGASGEAGDGGEVDGAGTTGRAGVSKAGASGGAGHDDHAGDLAIPRPGWQRRLGRRLERWLLERVIANPTRLARLARWARPLAPMAGLVYGRLPVDLPAPHRLRQVRLAVPDQARPRRHEPRGTVVLLRGCVTDPWFRAERLSTLRVLVHNGYRVRVVGPACCGALHRHAGLPGPATELGARAAELLVEGEDPPDHIVIESAGCAPALAEPLAETPAARRAAALVTDPFTLLEQHGWKPPRRPLGGDWVVAPPCHLRHGPLPSAAHDVVIERFLGCGYRELPAPDHCCGAAGTYSLRRPGLSRQIGQAALARFLETRAQGLLTANPGCLLRWESLLARHPRATVLHPMVALDRAYQESRDYRV